jgi:hypothetical protein
LSTPAVLLLLLLLLLPFAAHSSALAIVAVGGVVVAGAALLVSSPLRRPIRRKKRETENFGDAVLIPLAVTVVAGVDVAAEGRDVVFFVAISVVEGRVGVFVVDGGAAAAAAAARPARHGITARTRRRTSWTDSIAAAMAAATSAVGRLGA